MRVKKQQKSLNYRHEVDDKSIISLSEKAAELPRPCARHRQGVFKFPRPLFDDLRPKHDTKLVVIKKNVEMCKMIVFIQGFKHAMISLSNQIMILV